MFKRLLITTIVLSLSTIAFAQQQQDRWIWPDEQIEDAWFLQIGVGPKIEVGFASATNPSFFDVNLKGGFAYKIGGAVNVRIANHPLVKPHGIGRLGLEIEAFYGSRSFNAGNEYIVMKCLEIPMLFQFCVIQGLQVEAGVTPVKVLSTSPDYLQTGGVVANVGDLRGDDVMISVGVCYKTNFGLVIGLRYNHGLSEWAENFHSKTSSAMVSGSYLFPLINNH